MSDERVSGPPAELEAYLALLGEDGVGWDVRELCGRAIVGVARANKWTLAVKTEHRGGSVPKFLRRFEMDEQAQELWDRYRRTGDVQRLGADLAEHVAALEEFSMLNCMSAEDVLRAARSVLLIDWPSRDVPDTVARAGYAVTVKGGPDSYARYETVGDDVVRTPCERPERVDVVYVHRPVEELPGILKLAAELGCRAVWLQTPDARARELVVAAGMACGDRSIVEVLRG